MASTNLPYSQGSDSTFKESRRPISIAFYDCYFGYGGLMLNLFIVNYTRIQMSVVIPTISAMMA